jgi:hypothetical protein
MTFVTLAARAYSRRRFIPVLPDSTINFAAFMVSPFTGGKLARMTAPTPVANEPRISGYWIKGV